MIVMSRTHLVVFMGAVLVAALSIQREQDAAPPLATEVPIGGIILWWGTAAEIPEGYEACDGTVVKTKDAVLRGAKPNLESKFPRGAPAYRSFAPQAFAGGGSDTIVLDKNTVQLGIDPHDFKLTVEQLSRHKHDIPRLTHTVDDHRHTSQGDPHGMDQDVAGGAHTHDGVPDINSATTLVDLNGGQPSTSDDPYLPSFTSTTTGAVSKPPAFKTGASSKKDTDDDKGLTTSTTNGKPAADHADEKTDDTGASSQIVLQHKLSVTSTTIDNRPAFVDVVFLIHVK